MKKVFKKSLKKLCYSLTIELMGRVLHKRKKTTNLKTNASLVNG